VQVIANLSLMHAANAAPSLTSPWQARLILLVLERDWDGDVDTIPGAQVQASPGKPDMLLGHNSLKYQDGCYYLSLALEKRPITLMAAIRPLTYPLMRRNTPIGHGKISWVVVPRLAATGSLVVGGRVHRLQEAPTYHDHNWGDWEWGDDFAWQWGFALPQQVETPWSVVFDCMTNRGRSKAVELKLSLWKDRQLQRLFIHEEIRIQQTGFLTMPRLTKFPRSMALVSPELTTDVPRNFEVSARRGNDWLECRFAAADLAQIIVPNETNLGVTAINEVSGLLEVQGLVKGEPVSMSGRGFFEFLT
jgi:hypothetical protein